MSDKGIALPQRSIEDPRTTRDHGQFTPRSVPDVHRSSELTRFAVQSPWAVRGPWRFLTTPRPSGPAGKAQFGVQDPPW